MNMLIWVKNEILSIDELKSKSFVKRIESFENAYLDCEIVRHDPAGKDNIHRIDFIPKTKNGKTWENVDLGEGSIPVTIYFKAIEGRLGDENIKFFSIYYQVDKKV